MRLEGDRDRLLLVQGELLDARCGQIEQLVQAGPVERDLLGRCLDLDEAAVARHDDVDVDVGDRVLGVIQVEQRHSFHDAYRDRGDRAR